MNLASFYLCLFVNINTSAVFSEAALKCDIVGKEDNYKYLVASYTHHFRQRFTLSGFFFLQVCVWADYGKKLKFSFPLGHFV